MPPEFLVQQMEWRESLEDALAAQDVRAVAQLEIEVRAAVTEGEILLEHLLDRSVPDTARAAEEIRCMMFLVKFSAQLREEKAKEYRICDDPEDHADVWRHVQNRLHHGAQRCLAIDEKPNQQSR